MASNRFSSRVCSSSISSSPPLNDRLLEGVLSAKVTWLVLLKSSSLSFSSFSSIIFAADITTRPFFDFAIGGVLLLLFFFLFLFFFLRFSGSY